MKVVLGDNVLRDVTCGWGVGVLVLSQNALGNDMAYRIHKYLFSFYTENPQRVINFTLKKKPWGP